MTTTGWINPPKTYRTPQDELPHHYFEWGLVYEISDGTVWETVHGSGWVPCHPERAAFLKEKHASV